MKNSSLGNLLNEEIKKAELHRITKEKLEEAERRKLMEAREWIGKEGQKLLKVALPVVKEALGEKTVVSFIGKYARWSNIEMGERKYGLFLTIKTERINGKKLFVIITEKNILARGELRPVGKAKSIDILLSCGTKAVRLKEIPPPDPEGKITAENAILAIAKSANESLGPCIEITEESTPEINEFLRNLTAEKLVKALVKETFPVE